MMTMNRTVLLRTHYIAAEVKFNYHDEYFQGRKVSIYLWKSRRHYIGKLYCYKKDFDRYTSQKWLHCDFIHAHTWCAVDLLMSDHQNERRNTRKINREVCELDLT